MDPRGIHVEDLASFPAGAGGVGATVPAVGDIDTVGSAIHHGGTHLTSCEFNARAAIERYQAQVSTGAAATSPAASQTPA